MNTFSKFVAFLLLLGIGVAAPAWGHGGQYRGPGGSIPPNLREPSDPVPPAPVPPTGSPVTPPGTGDPRPGGAAPVTPTPVPTPDTGGGTAPEMGGQGRGTKSSLSFESWVFWYHHNKADIENLKKALYTRTTTESLLIDIGGLRRDNRSDATQAITAKVRSTIIPALLRTIDAETMHQDARSAAYIALAKMATDPQQVEILQKGLDLTRKPDVIVQESAAIGLGLLRRDRRSDQFPAGDLDRVRTFLFNIFESEDYGVRTRGFAALAIGLLGDQPSADEARTTAQLFDLLARRDSFPSQDLTLGLLMAIGLQRGPSLLPEHRAELRAGLLRGVMHKQPVGSLVRSYAALALGRVGDRSDINVLHRGMTMRRNKNRDIQRSCAIGLGQLGHHVQGEDRVAVADVLLEQIGRSKDASTRNFAIISLSDLLRADIRADRTDVLDGSKAGTYLLREAADGNYMVRPFAALALGLVGKQIGDTPSVMAYGEFRHRSIQVLRDGLQSKKLAKRGRAAYATALGILQDRGSIPELVQLAADKKEDTELRGYAALSLGLIGVASSNVLKPLRTALRERRTEELRQQMATALGLLRDREAVPLLLEELRTAKSQNVKGQVVLALARIGDARAVDPLIACLEDKQEQDLTRALACAGLGVIGDLEWLPSLSRISLDVNYRASTDLLNEALSLI
jgi:HEAT repeat protein